MSHPSSPSPQENLPRRDFLLRFASCLLTGALADKITGGNVAQSIADVLVPQNHSQSGADIEHEFDEAEKTIRKEHPEASDAEIAQKVIDYLGCGVFTSGVISLLQGGHITARHYGKLTAMLFAKYIASDEPGQNHLDHEFAASAQALVIISGTVVLAEGVKAELDTMYNSINPSEMSEGDMVGLLTLLSSSTSPLMTTVGAATLCKKISRRLAGDDNTMKAILTGHVANTSGFILFGDPPFIAICEKYGFREGIQWQAQTMWPMALYSLFSSAYKLNMVRAPQDLSITEKCTWAFRETREGIGANLGLLATIIKVSLQNAARFYGFTDFFGKEQNPQGLQFDVDTVLRQKFTGICALLGGNISQLPGAGEHHGLDDTSPRDHIVNIIWKTFFEDQIHKKSDHHDVFLASLDKVLRTEDDELIAQFAEENNIELRMVRTILEVAKGVRQKNTPLDPEESSQSLPRRIFDRVMYVGDLGHFKTAVGHNLGDIADVFPFQALCVPFLVTAFQDVKKSLEATIKSQPQMSPQAQETTIEAVLFLLIMAFSSIADNYVACKIGLDLFPDKPQIPLIASVIGGGMSAVGNMANIAQFDLSQFPLGVSFCKSHLHADMAVVGFFYAQFLDSPMIKRIFTPPPVHHKNLHARTSGTTTTVGALPGLA